MHLVELLTRKFQLSQLEGYQTSQSKQQPPTDTSKGLPENPSL